MYYYGLFRNTDTSIDPKGQEFKVCIFTEGKTYTYRSVGYDLFPESVEIRLSGNPFVVDYTNDKSNVYKPYKCSTASVGIILDRINPEFISKGKCDILVMLLKRKNEVVFHPGLNSYYENTITGEKLYQIVPRPGSMIIPYFPPDVENEFCYNIEWVGYATPNTYNQQYTRVIEEYVMECQDVLSTLKYYDYSSEAMGVRTFGESILRSLLLLPNNPISKLYITNTLRIPDTIEKPITDRLSTQNENWVDEDYEWENCLTVIENLMTYLNATIVQWKDSIYITTPDAISNHRGYYYLHEVDSNSRPLVLVEDHYDMSEGLGKGDTDISTSNTYKKVSVTTNEFYEDNLSIDLSDDNDYLDPISDFDLLRQYKTIENVVRQGLSHAHPYQYYFNSDNSTANFSGSILQYNPDMTKNLPYLETYSYWRDGQQGNDNDYLWIKTNQTTNAVDWSGCTDRAGCSIVDFGVQEISSEDAMADYFKSYSGRKVFLFHTTSNQIHVGTGTLSYSPLNCPDTYINTTNQDSRKMLHLQTKKVYLKSSQSIQLQGNWTFYQNQTIPHESGWAVEQLKACKPFMFIWMKISVHAGDTTYYVTNTSSSQYYSWTTNETYCKVWYDNFAGIDKDTNKRNRRAQMTTTNAFETQFSFTKNTRGADGTCIPLPEGIDGSYTSINITIARPFGCAVERRVVLDDRVNFFAPQFTVLSDFKVNVIDTEESEYRYSGDFNNEFVGDAYDSAIDDFSKINLMVSSDYYKNSSKATVIGIDNNRINNTGSGENNLPEANIISDIVRTYINSRLIMKTTLPKEVSPLTRVTWNTQMEGKTFVVDGLSIDYAYNDYAVNLVEKTLEDMRPHIYSDKKTRNYRRNGDLLFSPLPPKNKRDIEDPEEEEVNVQFNVMTDRHLYMRGESLLKDLQFEPYFEDGELHVYSPDYLKDRLDIFVNDNGEIILRY